MESTAEAKLCWAKLTVTVKDIKGTGRKLLREVFEANGYSLDYVYDWTVKQQVYPP